MAAKHSKCLNVWQRNNERCRRKRKHLTESRRIITGHFWDTSQSGLKPALWPATALQFRETMVNVNKCGNCEIPCPPLPPCPPKFIRTISAVLGIIQQIRIRCSSSRKIFSKKKQFDFFVCSDFHHTQCDCSCACAVAYFHTSHFSIPNVVVSLMMYDNIWIFVHVYVYLYAFPQGLPRK